MTESANTVLSEEAVAEIEALSAKVPDGPWFTASDDADDVPEHRRSGLALVETGRSADWWIARLCEWHIANFIAASKTNVDALCATVKALRAEIVEFEKTDLVPRSRYNAADTEAHEAREMVKTIAGRAKGEIERLEFRLKEVEQERDELREWQQGLMATTISWSKENLDFRTRALELCRQKAAEWSEQATEAQARGIQIVADGKAGRALAAKEIAEALERELQ